ncbi:hypothetical protein QCD60_26665 [Pokkaliibacter sp. MBI-7]|uniref:hypothetical protein n=1 Tax=Pokkaliibacter sp. MBI-7 TaxID=3040600 RepID=UPI0024483DFE|nr:hypothetical protein [Pokkaliibacter sp. MBI-7]MDH2436119.1 hypothetical protein [Pokkaliibacter sp. MBI-7]
MVIVAGGYLLSCLLTARVVRQQLNVLGEQIPGSAVQWQEQGWLGDQISISVPLSEEVGSLSLQLNLSASYWWPLHVQSHGVLDVSGNEQSLLSSYLGLPPLAFSGSVGLSSGNLKIELPKLDLHNSLEALKVAQSLAELAWDTTSIRLNWISSSADWSRADMQIRAQGINIHSQLFRTADVSGVTNALSHQVNAVIASLDVTGKRNNAMVPMLSAEQLQAESQGLLSNGRLGYKFHVFSPSIDLLGLKGEFESRSHVQSMHTPKLMKLVDNIGLTSGGVALQDVQSELMTQPMVLILENAEMQLEAGLPPSAQGELTTLPQNAAALGKVPTWQGTLILYNIPPLFGLITGMHVPLGKPVELAFQHGQWYQR